MSNMKRMIAEWEQKMQRLYESVRQDCLRVDAALDDLAVDLGPVAGLVEALIRRVDHQLWDMFVEGKEFDITLKAGDFGGTCSLCLEEMLEGGDEPVMLPCGHTFHKKCVRRWTCSCPMCRAPASRRTPTGCPRKEAKWHMFVLLSILDAIEINGVCGTGSYATLPHLEEVLKKTDLEELLKPSPQPQANEPPLQPPEPLEPLEPLEPPRPPAAQASEQPPLPVVLARQPVQVVKVIAYPQANISWMSTTASVPPSEEEKYSVFEDSDAEDDDEGEDKYSVFDEDSDDDDDADDEDFEDSEAEAEDEEPGEGLLSQVWGFLAACGGSAGRLACC